MMVVSVVTDGGFDADSYYVLYFVVVWMTVAVVFADGLDMVWCSGDLPRWNTKSYILHPTSYMRQKVFLV